MGTHLYSLKSNLQIFSIGKTSMAETWKKNVVIDAQDHLAGRLCATVAKELVRGNNVTIVRCEGIFITGNYYRNKLIMLEKMNHRTATNPKDAPFHHRAPSMMIKRMIRGLPTTIRHPEKIQDHRCLERNPISSRPKSRFFGTTLPRSRLAIPRCRWTT